MSLQLLPRPELKPSPLENLCSESKVITTRPPVVPYESEISGAGLYSTTYMYNTENSEQPSLYRSALLHFLRFSFPSRKIYFEYFLFEAKKQKLYFFSQHFCQFTSDFSQSFGTCQHLFCLGTFSFNSQEMWERINAGQEGSQSEYIKRGKGGRVTLLF